MLSWKPFFFFSWRRWQKHKTKVQRKAKPAPYLSTHRVIKVTGNIVYVSGRVTLTLSSRFESFYSSTVTCVWWSTCRSRQRIKTQGWNPPRRMGILYQMPRWSIFIVLVKKKEDLNTLGHEWTQIKTQNIIRCGTNQTQRTHVCWAEEECVCVITEGHEMSC